MAEGMASPVNPCIVDPPAAVIVVDPPAVAVVVDSAVAAMAVDSAAAGIANPHFPPTLIAKSCMLRWIDENDHEAPEPQSW